MVQAIERVISAAELLARGAKIIKALRDGGNGDAANVLQAECNRLAKGIVRVNTRRRAAAAKARKQSRNNGRFS